MAQNVWLQWLRLVDVVRDSGTGLLLGEWTGSKVCRSCASEFRANSGNQIWCKACCCCLECGIQMSNHAHKYCSASCAGKANFRSPAVKAVLIAGRSHPNRGRGISRTRTGKARHDMRGPLNSNWRGGGLRDQRHALMGTVEYKNWRRAVFARDRFTCQHCHQVGGHLNADHIVPYVARPDLALDLSNGRTLCVSCHRLTPTWGEGAKRMASNLHCV